jgi:hypothetical protein
MKLARYNQFINLDSLNENLDKAKKYLKERYMLLTAAREADALKGELAAQIQHKEIRSVRLIDFTPEQREEIKAKLRDIKLTPELTRSLERDEEFIKVRQLKATVNMSKGPKEFQLDRDNIGWLSIFTYIYYFENISLEDLSSLYRRLLSNKDILQNLEIEVSKGKLEKKQFDPNIIDENVPNNYERISDGLDRLESSRKAKRIYDTLTPELKASYEEASDLHKEKFLEIAEGFEMAGKRPDGTLDEAKKKQIWDGFFGQMAIDQRRTKPDGSPNPTFGKLVYQSTLRRYKTIHEFLVAANGYLASTEMDGFENFIKQFTECNKRLGAAGAEMVFNENGIVIIEVNSFAANQMLNSHTSHCIKDNIGHWNSYVANHDNKQYYIYNFHIPLRDNFSTVGITIEPGKRVRACHNRPDHSMTAEQFKALLKKWENEYDIDKDLWSYFLPMTGEEVEKRRKAKEANRKIVEPNITIEQIEEYVTEYGADINKDEGKCLVNSVQEDNYEKTKYILQLGGLPNLKKGRDAAISYAKNIEMVKLLVDFGAEMTGDVFKSVIHDGDALHYCLNAGLDPKFQFNLPLRTAIKGDFNPRDKDKDGKPYWESFLILMKYLERMGKDKLREQLMLSERGQRSGLLAKWAGEYGRIDVIKYWDENLDLFEVYSDKDWRSLLEWIEASRMVRDEIKQKTLNYLKEIKKKHE